MKRRALFSAVALLAPLVGVACEGAGPLGEEPSVYSGRLELDQSSKPGEPRFTLVRPGLITGGPIAVDVSEIEDEAYGFDRRFVEIFGRIEGDGEGGRVLRADLIRRLP